MAHPLRTRLLTAATGATLIAVGWFPPDSLGEGLSAGELLHEVLPAVLICVLGGLFIGHALADGGTALIFRRGARAPDFNTHRRSTRLLLERGKAAAALARCRIYLQQAPRDPRGFELALRVAGEELGSARELRRLLGECGQAKLAEMDQRRLRQRARELLRDLEA